MLTQPLYSYDVYTLKNYRHFHKLTLYKCLRNSGVEDKRKKNFSARNTVNNQKLLNNISRAKSLIYQYALCNDFDYFCTFTIDDKKYDRENLKLFYNDLGNWFREYRRYHNIDKINYIFIPELHKDKKCWHMHGLISGIKSEHLTLFDLDKHPTDLTHNYYLNFEKYQKKFGFCSFGILEDKEKASSYIIKYITKDLTYTQQKLNHKLYYCSRGLNKATIEKKGYMYVNPDIEDFDFKNDYCMTMNIDNNQTDYVKNLFIDNYSLAPTETTKILHKRRIKIYENDLHLMQLSKNY